MLGPVGLAPQLHGDEALEHGTGDGAVIDHPPLGGSDQVREEPAVDDVQLGALDLAAAEVDVPRLELTDEEQVFEDRGVGSDGVGVQSEVATDPMEARETAGPCGDDEVKSSRSMFSTLRTLATSSRSRPMIDAT